MDLVVLIQGGVAADAGEQEGDEGGGVFFREFGIEGGKFAGIVGAEHRWHHHAGDNEPGGGIFFADTFHNPLEPGPGDAGLDAAETVVAAECEHEHVHGLAENPVDAAGAAGGGLATQAGVDDPPREAGRRDFLLNEGRVGLGGGIFEPVAGGQAVAEENQGARVGGRKKGGEHAKADCAEKAEGIEAGTRSHAGFCVVRVFRGRLP